MYIYLGWFWGEFGVAEAEAATGHWRGLLTETPINTLGIESGMPQRIYNTGTVGILQDILVFSSNKVLVVLLCRSVAKT